MWLDIADWTKASCLIIAVVRSVDYALLWCKVRTSPLEGWPSKSWERRGEAAKVKMFRKRGIWFSPCSDLELPARRPFAKPELAKSLSAIIIITTWNTVPLEHCANTIYCSNGMVVMMTKAMTLKVTWCSPGRQLRVLPGCRPPLWRGNLPSAAAARTRRGSPRGPTPGEPKFSISGNMAGNCRISQ